MVLQQLGLVPKELLVQIEGASSLVRPKVEYLGEYNTEMPVLARRDGFHQLYLKDNVSVYKGLKSGKQDGYSSLAGEQALVQTKKVSKDVMVDILSRFGVEVLENYAIWDGILDWQPDKRIKGYKLQNANAVVYTDWNLKGEELDVSNAKVIPVNWMEESGEVSKEMIQQFSIPENFDVWADKKYAINNYKGLNRLLWVFWDLERPGLFSFGGPRVRGSYWGSLLGSGLSADEMVNNFDPSKVKVEPEPKISKYQMELKRLEEDLGSFKSLYAELGGKITSMEDRLANLKKIKPE